MLYARINGDTQEVQKTVESPKSFNYDFSRKWTHEATKTAISSKAELRTPSKEEILIRPRQ